MEVDLKRVYVELTLVDGTRVTFTGNLLKYIVHFQRAYAEGFTEFIESADFALEESLWRFIRDVYKEHDDIYGDDDDKEALRTPIQLDESRHVKAIQLADLYRMTRILNYYEAPLMLDFVLKVILDRLMALPRKELFLANPKVKSQSVETLSATFTHPYQWINKAYNIRLRELDTIFRQYIETHDLVALIERLFLPRTTSVLAACFYSIMLITQRGLFTTGNNEYGQLGLGRRTMNETGWYPVPLRNVISVWCGPLHSMMLTVEGLYACGNNEYGQLGVGDFGPNRVDKVFSPMKVTLEGVLEVACGANHTLIRTRQGLYACGRNHLGQLGIGITVGANTPKEVDFKEQAVTMACGADFSLILSAEGNVYGCGSTLNGVLGRDPIEVRMLLTPGEIVMPDEARGQIVSITAGSFHALFLDKRGQVYALGRNGVGQLGLGDIQDRYMPTKVSVLTQRIVSMSGGFASSFFIDEAGDLYACGRNATGQLGVDDTVDRHVPVKVPGLEQVISVASGYTVGIFLTCDGLFLSGARQEGETGLLPAEKLPIEVAVEPICKTRVLVLQINEDFPVHHKRRRLACHRCGCDDCDKLGLYKPSARLFCSHDCLTQYRQFRV